MDQALNQAEDTVEHVIVLNRRLDSDYAIVKDRDLDWVKLTEASGSSIIEPVKQPVALLFSVFEADLLNQQCVIDIGSEIARQFKAS